VHGSRPYGQGVRRALARALRTNVNPGVGGFEQTTAVGVRNDGSVVAAGVAAPGTSGFLYAVAVYRNR
jgi:hypothetical protein